MFALFLPARIARRLVRLLAVLILTVAVLLAVGAVYVATLPGVGDAQARARSEMASHHEPVHDLPTPPRLVAAVVSTEDEHFFDNVVVNVLTGAGRAALATLHTSRDPGGSTIDQQLAKLLYGHGSGAFHTLREIGLGIKLALHWSKHQILQMYLNVAYYGQGFWGVEAASEGYFRTAPARLDWGEAAMLAGLLQAPSAYDPVTHLKLARERQRHVLAQLVANGHLTTAQARTVYRQRLPLAG
ncbi:MAG: transglycosylase domain-containing protein [Solirubrobacteraceae bacterium]